MDASPRATILIWAVDPDLASELTAALADFGRDVRVLEDDAELASSARTKSLLVAQAGPRLEAQHEFRCPLDRSG